VFAELLRSVPNGLQSSPGEASEGCNPRPGAPKLAKNVEAFFSADLLSPVFDSALVFDIPGLMVPWLRFGMDRAQALEYGFEDAWRKIGTEKGVLTSQSARYGLEANFYGRWKPDGPAPALFLAATGVSTGAPVLVSQIAWSQDENLLIRRLSGTPLVSADSKPERSSLIGNILDFRPDLQLATSTAIALSARFPYVEPPANIRRNEKIMGLGFYHGIKVLELLDGGYFDNSGAWVAINMLKALEGYQDALGDLKDDIAFHLVRFTDRPAQLYGKPREVEHFELVAPLVAFNTVRLVRGAESGSVNEWKTPRDIYETFIYLADPWFAPSLNWLLSQDTKAKIELRSGGEPRSDSAFCCSVDWAIDGVKMDMPTLRNMKWEDA
jgi:hypothetical protein